MITLIKDAQVADGTGRPMMRTDVLTKDDRIVAIGNFSDKKADTVIQGMGNILAPGFIDVNTDSDHYLTLFTHPSQREFLLQGVTTIIGGHCGSSLAPLIYGSLESIRKWADVNQINVNWRTVREFLKVLGAYKIGVNFGTLAGHSTIRRALIGESLRDLTSSELEVFKGVVKQSMEEGAFGLSTGLGYAHSRQVPFYEIKTLSGEVERYGGVYATHLRNEREGVIASVNETLQLAKETGVKTLISHFRPLVGFEKDFEAGLAFIETSRGSVDIHFDTYPFDTSVVPIYTLLPGWVQNGGLEVMLANLRSDFLRERILRELPDLSDDDIVVAQAPGADYLVGKSLGTFSKNQELNLKAGLLKMMLDTNLRAVVFYKNINLGVTMKSFESEAALVASNSPSLAEAMHVITHERAVNTFPKFLQLVGASKMMSIEQAVKRITKIPADKFGIKNRGEIKEGNFADLTMFRDGSVTHVWVNGSLAVKDGAFQNSLAGRVLVR